jgi:4-diphosphocytidyl-2-C-methyl-D-erythritol kinase
VYLNQKMDERAKDKVNMKKIIIKAPAKINLSLDVTGKRQDGYHEVEMIMQSIELCDTVYLTKTRGGIDVSADCLDVPLGNDNIAYKAAKAMQDVFCVGDGVDIYIKKSIPMAAGLAGGSADAAAVIWGLNRIWDIDANRDELMKVAVSIGADVPFCIMGGTALAQGIGERLTPLSVDLNCHVVIVKPPISVSTGKVYSSLDLIKTCKRPNTTAIIDFLKAGDIEGIGGYMENVLEDVTETIYGGIYDIKREINRFKPLGVLMSGSGPSVYGLFNTREEAYRAYLTLKETYGDIYITRTCPCGVCII